MRKPEIMNYEGRSIFFMDFTGLRDVSSIEALVKESKDYIRMQPEKSVLTLTNLDGMHFNAEIKNIFSEFISGNKEYVAFGAVVGLSGLQRIVYNGIMKLTGRDIRSFETLDLAKAWLTSRELSPV